eukprot:8501617-Pyramimonas_sp.AAC.1
MGAHEDRGSSVRLLPRLRFFLPPQLRRRSPPGRTGPPHGHAGSVRGPSGSHLGRRPSWLSFVVVVGVAP